MASTLKASGRPSALSGTWHCRSCRYSNVGAASVCGMCGVAAPASPTVAPALLADAPAGLGLDERPPAGAPVHPALRELWAEAERGGTTVGGIAVPGPELAWGDPGPAMFGRHEPPAGRRATRTVAGVVVANLALQAFGLGLAVAAHLDPTHALELGLAIALIFYGLTAVWVTVRSEILGVVPRWLIGGRGLAVALGMLVGAGGAVGLTLALSSAAGHPIVDPVSALLADEPLIVLLLGAVIIAGLAPLIEELVFRGFLAEALRERGAPVAVAVSAIAFAIAHLRFAQLQYYAAMGVVLGLIYWKRGLVASISAHAAFNGALIVIAVIAAHGPAQTVNADGVTFRLPATWHALSVPPGPVDYAALGPGGAQVKISHDPLPAGASWSAEVVADALRSQRLALPGDLVVDPGSVQVVQLGVGTVVSVHVVAAGRGDDAVIFSNPDGLVAIEMFADGSSAGAADLERMLASLHSVPL